MSIEVLRTPEERFALLPNFPYPPSYTDSLEGFEGLRLHYVDAGSSDADDVFLCLHGEPTWSYLYRKMIPVFEASGGRVIAPDFFGFGRSDKPVNDADYTFSFHRNTLVALIEQLDLRNITLVCQDWGGILGLTLPMDMPERFKRLIVMNTALPVGEPVSDGFAGWKAYAGSLQDIPVSGLMAMSCPGALDMMDIAAYAAPFPDASYQGGVRRFPQLVPVEPGMEGVVYCARARTFFNEQWSGKSFMACGSQDVVLGMPVMEELRSVIRGCPPIMEVPEAGHFVQEWGAPIARAALESFA
jgi:pimeloyl-ACP methyl ester carboxylesterase